VLAFIRRLINFAVKRGMCDPQPHLHFEMPEVDNIKTEVLNQAQLERLVRVLDEEPDQVAAGLIRLALTTGMRKGALLGLQWEDVDFDRGFITLRGDAAKKGKTEIIPLSHSARTVLESVPRSGSKYVFPGRNGGKRQDFRRVALRVKKKAGLPDDFRPLHGLRHTYASLLASSGKVDLYTLQKLLTHSSPQMTQRYAHLADEAMKRAASVADLIFAVTQNSHEGTGDGDSS
jgi:integrase